MRSWLPALGALLLLLVASPAHAADPDALWKIVHGACVPDQRLHGDPRPCAAVDLAGGEARGYAVLKDNDPRKPTHFLLIPTVRLTGIESPDLLAAGAPDYFVPAWAARARVAALAGRRLPREDYGLAINSVSGRTQDQLHIHVDCVSPGVRDALHARGAAITRSWRRLDVAFSGHRYLARRLAGADLAADPFDLLATGVPGARAEMGRWTLAVIGAHLEDDAPGFWLLADRADPATGDRGSAEELLDEACALGHS